MGSNSDIEWTDATWNPTRGCSLVSDGCTNCYAMKFAHRFSGKGGRYEGLTVIGNHGPRWTGRVREVHEMLAEPLRWRKPRRIFVNSMSDLFHEDVSDDFIDRVFGVMSACQCLGGDGMPGHTFQVLTKRAARMALYLSTDRRQRWAQWAAHYGGAHDPDGIYDQAAFGPLSPPNVWLGVSVEDQRRADERIPHLLRVPAAVRFLSCEPLLEHVNLQYTCFNGADSFGTMPGIHWVIVGGESGNGARPMHPDWARSLRDQCVAAGVAFHFKQWGNWSEIPYDHESPPGNRHGERYLNAAGGHGFHGEKVVRIRTGHKKANGRELDGRTWDEFPSVLP